MDTAELNWIEQHAPADAAMVRAVNDALAAHDKWDSNPEFQLLVAADDGRIVPQFVTRIDLRTRPVDYPAVLGQQTGGYLGKLVATAPSRPVLACLFRFEGYGLSFESEADMSPEERAAIANRQIRAMPHRIETALVYAADPRGQVWQAVKRRGTDGDPDRVISPGAHTPGITGNIPEALRACAGMIPAAYVAASQSFWASRVKERG